MITVAGPAPAAGCTMVAVSAPQTHHRISITELAHRAAFLLVCLVLLLVMRIAIGNVSM
jgi:hypothetical protein